MNTPSLWFNRIEIRRMPGFESGAFAVDELAEGAWRGHAE